MMADTSAGETLKVRTKHYFNAHGRFCASHPWEVIVTIVTLTVCVLSISLVSGGKVSGLNPRKLKSDDDEQAADTVLLSIVNSLAVIYIYNQFSSLRKEARSNHLLVIAGLFTIFASFVFGSGVVNLIDDKVSGLNEALPFFLLLIDLSKASALAKFAFKSRTKEEVRDNIGRGMSVLGPNMTLDTLVEVLLIGIGTISGIRQLEMLCCFGCMSIVANYLVFMTLFPASLALVLEVCPCDPSNPAWHLDELAWGMREEEGKPNPVVQRVKVIMALGLLVVHLHSRFLSTVTGISLGLGPREEESSLLGGVVEGNSIAGGGDIEKVPLQEYLWWKAFNPSADQLITITLATVLFVKYIFFDKSKTFDTSVPPTPTFVDKRVPPASIPTSCPSRLLEPPLLRNRGVDRTPSISIPEQRYPLVNGSVGNMQSEEFTRLLSQGVTINTGETDSVRLALPSVEQASNERNESKPLMKSLPENCVEEDVQCVSMGTQTNLREEEVFPRVAWGEEDEEEEEERSDCSEERDQAERDSSLPPRPLEECLAIFKSDSGTASLSDEEILQLVAGKHIPAYKLEGALGDPERGVTVRRKLITKQLNTASSLDNLPFTNYDYSLVMGACCENVIGYMPVPVGVAGPLLLDGVPYYIPMATTEGTLVASTNRGCRAVASTGGVKSYVVGDGMTRGPVVRLPSAAEASALKLWLDDRQNFSFLEEHFSSTSRFAKLKSLQTAIAGRLVYIRFKATTGDAMGMNMLSKGVERVLEFVKSKFPEMDIISLSGNFCTDKKPAAINWLEGRGKSVVCEATVPAQVVKQVLKTSVDALVDLNISKNLVGSAMAGSIGGFNAHAANVVSAIFIATGQDPAQNVASSNCITLMERSGEDLYMSCTMPSVEIGTVGGGTILPPQATCLKMLGVHGPHHENPGENATQLARIVCATVLAGELSLLSALAAGHLVRSHLTHNRSDLNLASIPKLSLSSEPKRTL